MITQNRAQVETYVSQVTTELRSLDMLNQDWGHVLNSAPVAIGILGECMIVASMRKASFIQLEGPNLALSLPANIMKAAQVGTTTFVEAHTRMNEIAMHAENVGRKGGTIDKIIDRVEGKDSPAARRMLTRQLALLQSAADVCTAEANEINKYFKIWQQFTNSLLYAMTIRKDAIVMEQNERNEELKQEELVKETKAKELVRAERLLQEKKQQLADAGDGLDDLYDTARVRGKDGITAGLGVVNPALGLMFMAGVAFEVMLAENQVELAREYYEKQQKAAEDAKTATQELEAALKKIQQETSTLEEVIHVLFEAIKRLQSLQTEITALLLFFQTIAGRVRFLVQRLTKEFIDNVEDEDSRASHTYEEDLQNEIRETALPIKAQFMVIYQIAQVYSEVSFVHILEGLSLVNMLGLSHNSTTPADMALKQHKLDRYKSSAAEGVKSLTQKKRSEMNEGLKELVHNSARRSRHA